MTNLTGALKVRERLELIGVLNGIRKAIVASPASGIERCDSEIAELCDITELRSTTSADRMRKLRERRAAAKASASPQPKRRNSGGSK